MKRLPVLFCALIGGLLLMGAEGCSSDPNVEGAKLDLRNKDYDRALENLDTALAANPANAEALELKGKVLSELATTETDPVEHARLIQEMVVSYDRAAEADPAMAELIGRNKAFAYVAEFRLGIEAFNRAREDDSQYGIAAGHFGNSAVIAPDSAGAYVNQAYAYLNGGMADQAVGPFETALEKGDTEVDTYRFLASLYQTNDRAEDAVALLETAAASNPDNTDVQSELLNAYQIAGQIDRAVERYEEAVAANPDNALYRYNYGSLLVQMDRYDDAIAQLELAIELDPEYANAQYNLGAAYINRAVFVNEQVSTLDDALRAERSNLSDDEIDAKEAEIDGLVDQRRGLFTSAIAPLAAAMRMFEANGDATEAVCQALYQSYVQTNQLEEAQGVAACAGYDEN